MSDRPAPHALPPTTTHDWAVGVDLAHLAQVRRSADLLAPGGALHLLLEVVAYADEEAAERGGGTCLVTAHADGSFTVADDGRGTETTAGPDGRPLRKPVMSTRDVRLFDAAVPPRLPDGHPRRGASVVSALSSRLVHLNRRVEGGWSQEYVRGVPVGDLVRVEPDGTTGTTVHVLPDATMLGAGSALPLDLSPLRWPAIRVRVRDERPRGPAGPVERSG